MSAVDASVGAAPRFRRSRLLTDPLFAGLWIVFALAHLRAWRTTHHPVGLGETLTEVVFAGLFLCRRTPWVTSRSPVAWLVSVGGGFGMIAARPAYAPALGVGLAPLYTVLQLAGAAFAVGALLFLGRSFGVVAANRGVRTAGPYRLVRHPIYAGYALAELGYVLENPSLRNVVIVLAVSAFQVGRIRAEEACLENDTAYRRYREHVRYRLVPGIW